MCHDPDPRTLTAVLALVACLMGFSPGSTAAQDGPNAVTVQRALSGTWTGDGTTLTVDTQRLQVNMDPEKPFEWKALRLINVSGRMIVFDVGPMRYIALMRDPRTMTLTSPSFSGERSLHLTER